MTPYIQLYREALGDDWADGLVRYVPDHMIDGVVRYIVRGHAPGRFLTAVLCNDLMGALRRADDTNRDRLWSYGNFLHNYAPSDCFGSPAKFKAWVESGGVKGQRGWWPSDES